MSLLEPYVPTGTVGALAQYVPHAAKSEACSGVSGVGSARAADRVMAKIDVIETQARMMSWEACICCRSAF